MSNKEKFRNFLNKFSRDQLIGWNSAIAFIVNMKGVSKKLSDKLLTMYEICDDVIFEKEGVK